MDTKSNNLIRLAYGRDSLSARQSSFGLHLMAMLTAGATFPLIFIGGLVTSHHAGMSVPDWPNSYGYNMFLFPPRQWVGGILYEHTHRLMATVVGNLAILLVIWAWRGQIIAGCRSLKRLITRSPADAAESMVPVEPHRYMALAVLIAVIFQGILGGLRVVLVKLDLAIVHACVAQAFFCLTAYMALITSKWWDDQAPPAILSRLAAPLAGRVVRPESITSFQYQSNNTTRSPDLRGLFRLGIITVLVIYLQLIVGATMRHFDAGLAIPDLPLAYGKVLPPTSAEGLEAVNRLRAYQLNLDPVTLGQIWLHFAHRIGAVMVSGLVIAFALTALRRSNNRDLTRPVVILLLLLTTQVTLGVLTVHLGKPADVASAHVAVGALVLVTSFILAARVGRLYRRAHAQTNRLT